MRPQSLRMIISGGGTGGHLFPAIAIAQKLKERYPQSEILFVGAQGKMEMEKVPKYGYAIEGLWISGFNRNRMSQNIILPFKVISSLLKAMSIVRKFKPDIAVGVGGYASGPLLWAAEKKHIPTLLQEQNSFPGITNKMLAPKAKKICVAFPGMEKFFEQSKLVFTGNPVREDLILSDKQEAKRKLGFKVEKPLVLILGGSLGSRTINNTLKSNFTELNDMGINVLWQTGKGYYDEMNAACDTKEGKRIKITAFIDDMATAYSAADVVVSRAGALSIAEITKLGKASILIPSPNVAEDHQTKNADVLVKHQATVSIKDVEAMEKLIPAIVSLLNQPMKIKELESKAKEMARPDACDSIVDEIIKLCEARV